MDRFWNLLLVFGIYVLVGIFGVWLVDLRQSGPACQETIAHQAVQQQQAPSKGVESTTKSGPESARPETTGNGNKAKGKRYQPGKDFWCALEAGDLVVFLAGWAALGAALLQIFFLGGTLDATDKNVIATSKNAEAAALTADAAVRAQMPILFPLITDSSRMLPFANAGLLRVADNFVPRLTFVFENYGKTPAIVVETKFALMVYQDFPENPPWEHPTVLAEDRDVIPGERRFGHGGIMKVLHHAFHRPLTEAEIAGINSNPTPEHPNPHRFYFYGVVTYDDVFGYRHVKGFGRKVFPVAEGIPSQRIKAHDKYEYYERYDRRTGERA